MSHAQSAPNAAKSSTQRKRTSCTRSGRMRRGLPRRISSWASTALLIICLMLICVAGPLQRWGEPSHEDGDEQ